MSSDQIFFASIPPYKSRSKLAPPTVDRCLTHWASALHTLRHLPDAPFAQQITPTSSFTKFLLSYISNDDLSRNDTDDWVYPSSSSSGSSQEAEAIATKAKYINRSIRLCLKRAINLGVKIQDILPESDLSKYIKLGALFFVEGGSKPLLRSIWNQDSQILITATKEYLTSISGVLRSLASSGGGRGDDSVVPLLQEFCYFIMAVPEVSFEVLAEETVFEDLAAAYFSLSSSGRKDAVAPVLEEIRRLQFTIIMASTQTETKRYSTVIDFIFNFIAGADTDVPRNSYITAIISQTPLLDRLTVIDAEGYTNRWSTILAKLQNFDSQSPSSSKRISKLPRKKAKSRNNTQSINPEDTAHKLHELSQLFPHTPTSTLEAALTSTNHNLESATLLLLDNPPEPTEPTPKPQEGEEDLTTLPPSRLYLGKRNLTGTADNLLKDRLSGPSKSQILSALQAFDSDDDERDDTYDQDDVGAVDPTTGPEPESSNNNPPPTSEERGLYTALVHNPTIFSRDAVTRRSQERKTLRETTGMSDEAIEGWKIMLDRDPKRLRQLEIKFSRDSEPGEQSTLQRTAYRKGDSDEEAEGSGNNNNARRGGHRGRGRGRFGPNDRNVSGQQRDHAAVINPDGKEPYVGKKTSKARGEHNRKMQSAARDRQRTKKMSKGM
ncbi:hypothetical protein TWF481_012113 [Arthrobotrys musiformis]|uniref:CUE domain-containing protein n=1 Tax=Arthrobotrys musiformis TaxID=47236 RepID=A0AAV9VYK0_9PEZI